MSLELGVKFCGVTSLPDIRKAENVDAQAVGVIVQPEGIPRVRKRDSHTLTLSEAYHLRDATPSSMDFVLLPRAGGVDTIGDMVEVLVPDRLQIGHVEDPALMAALRDRYGKTIELDQVIHVGEGTKAADIDPFLDEADYIHIDSEGSQPGGNGVTPDLDISRAIADRAHEAGKLVIFSGGLTKELVPVVLEKVQPNGLDTESANRSEFGVYNQKMMQEFVDAAV